jgi:cell division protein ZapE
MSFKDFYQDFLEKNSIKLDQAQEIVLSELFQFASILTEYIKSKNKLFRFLNKSNLPHKGIYLYGPVGRGKSALTQAFFEKLPLEKKHRFHFHEFMQMIHKQLHDLRKQYKSNNDLIQQLVKNLSKDIEFLYLDELQITDITDAMLVGRLFKEMFNQNIFIVCTSNRQPDDLYKDGLQRENFLGFIELIKKELKIISLNYGFDYRQAKIKAIKTTFFTPLGDEANRFIKNAINTLIGQEALYPTNLTVNSRNIELPTTYKNILISSFHNLCDTALGAADYIEICKNFDILILQNIPVLKPENRNEAKRFVTLIDNLYEGKILLICTSEAKIEEIYPSGDGSFEFERTISRLIEMQSDSYLMNSKGSKNNGSNFSTT